ncbi:MAG: hypothetical protein J6M36_00580 [Prevotella sp.]|nr:hypothetical protein [Prevotella sp.]
MTEEEKKEFEEFLQWKKDKAEKENIKNQPEDQPQDSEIQGEPLEEIESNDAVRTQVASSVSQPDNNGYHGCFTVFGVFIAFVFILMIISFFTSKSTTPQSPAGNLEDNEIVEVVDTDLASPYEFTEGSKKTWDISTSTDDMTDTKNIWAKITSDNYVSQEFPYEGFTYASITVRYMKKYGYDVLIEITKGQISGSEYNGTDYITARFDDGAPKKYHFNEASDGSSEVVFIRNKSDFISRCKKAKDIKIDLPLYKGGRPVFTFHVDEPLVWPQN